MSDLISRQAAIKAVEDLPNCPNGFSDTYDKARIIGLLEELPSAQERKKGEWMEHYSHEDGERDGVKCSECGTHYYFGGQLMNFCPNCGAEMRGEEDDSDKD